jgi:hypothetical protein
MADDTAPAAASSSSNWAKAKEHTLDVASVVLQARGVKRAQASFDALLLEKPQRPPMPGTATPAGYVIHRRRAPRDASKLERFRDHMLDAGTHPLVAYLQVVWFLALVPVFVLFVATLLYWFGWGTATFDEYGCVANTSCCTCAGGALTYKLEDYWQERMAQGLSALFTYSALLATPWRLSIAVQCFGGLGWLQGPGLGARARCKGKGVGVDFYGRPNEMPFFHLPWGARAAIAIFLNLNTVCQLTHQILHIVWNSVVSYFAQPNGLIFLATGPGAGIITGPVAAAVQIWHESKLHRGDPQRFPPTPIDSIRQLFTRVRGGSSAAAVLDEMRRGSLERARRRSTMMTAFEAQQESAAPSATMYGPTVDAA